MNNMVVKIGWQGKQKEKQTKRDAKNKIRNNRNERKGRKKGKDGERGGKRIKLNVYLIFSSSASISMMSSSGRGSSGAAPCTKT